MKAPFQSPAGAAGTDFSQAEIIVAREADIKGGAGGADFRPISHGRRHRRSRLAAPSVGR